MTVTGKGICELLEGLAPLELAEPWDNPGWQLGDPGVPVERVLLSLDVDEGVCREAIEMSARLIITHHPLFFKEIKEIRLDSPRGALVAGLIKAGIGVYAAHTNLDSARWGVNDALARRLNLRDIQVLRPVREKYLKLVVFVPLDHVDGVREALGKAGAGWIGNYSDCTFGVQGTGTFRPREGTNPYIGTRGQLEKVPEVRLETILPKRLEKQVIEAMLQAHPYEEVAYDLYPLANSFPTGRGLGRVGNLETPRSLEDFVTGLQQVLELSGLRWGGEGKRPVRRVALCGGAGAGLWPEALARGADVLVTGDIGYHDARDMLSAGLNFVDAGHFGTERVILPVLRDYLQEACREKGLPVEFLISRRERDPYNFRS